MHRVADVRLQITRIDAGRVWHGFRQGELDVVHRFEIREGRFYLHFADGAGDEGQLWHREVGAEGFDHGAEALGVQGEFLGVRVGLALEPKDAAKAGFHRCGGLQGEFGTAEGVFVKLRAFLPELDG